MTAHVVVHFDGAPMPIVLFVGEPCFLSIEQILDRYAETHGFERKDLTGYWAPLLDYQKQAAEALVIKMVNEVGQFLKDPNVDWSEEPR